MSDGAMELHVKNCNQCGFCCTQGPCQHGTWNKVKKCCSFLAEADKQGRRTCLKYEEIKNDIMFGCGCSSSLFNIMRDMREKFNREKGGI